VTTAPFLELAAHASSEDALLEGLADLLRNLSGATGCDIFLRTDNDGLVLRASTYSPEYVNRCRLGKGVGMCGQTALHGTPTFVPKHAGSHPHSVSYPGIDNRAYEAVAALPLTHGQTNLGVVLFFREEPWLMPATFRRKLGEFAVAASMTIAAYQNALRVGSQASTLEALSQVSRTIASSPYLEEILQLLVNLTAQQFNYAVCTVRLLDERRGELVLRATQAPAKAYQRKPAIKLGESIAGRAIAENRPVVVQDVLSDPEYIGHDLAAEQGLRSMVCIPLTLQDRPLGVMSCYTTEVRDFTAEEIAALETIAKQAAFAIEHATLQVRSTLMQEMHHRVKNNLQQVASLLRLQARHGQYKSLEEALNDSLARILAISAVHELLSREDLDHVGMRSLADNLVQHQRESLMLPNKRIRFEVRGDDVHLNTTQATQVALILNELLLNAIEHGFEQSAEGDIHVTVEDKDGKIGLWVSNNGDPLPDSFDLSRAGLGLKIVENLSKGLGGHFLIEDRLGWTVAELLFVRSGAE
jgi:two-component sensor histidine kinase